MIFKYVTIKHSYSLCFLQTNCISIIVKCNSPYHMLHLSDMSLKFYKLTSIPLEIIRKPMVF